MRFPALFLFTAVLACAAPPVDTPPITAPEIARLLGIDKWTIPAAEVPEHYSIYVQTIENGRLGPVVFGLGGLSRSEPVTVFSRAEGDDVVVTFAHGQSYGSWRGRFGHSSMPGPWPSPVAPHTYVLWADYRRQGIHVDLTGKVADMVSGAALKIVADSPPTAAQRDP